MRIAFIGCGYVFDIYMRTKWAHPELEICGVFDIDADRLETVAHYYGFHSYNSFDAMLSDPKVEIIVNLTSIRSHEIVTRKALEAGKHVYSEKPITTDLIVVQDLFSVAQQRGLVLTRAPCNLYSDAICTVWKAVRDGAIGKPVLVYAELDDNPAHLMNLEQVRSPTGAPFPYAEEFQEGCTVEHISYHLAWICALFGPVLSMTAFSHFLISHKTNTPLIPTDTPDLSVCCLTFANGIVARITCSWVAPRDHRFHIIGDEGQISLDNVFHDQAIVELERFSRVSLSGRKSRTARREPFIGRMFGIGGRRISLIKRWKSHAVEADHGARRSLKQRFVDWFRRREIYAQDKLLGIAEMVRSIKNGRPQPMQPDFLTHLTELTLIIHRAGPEGVALVPTTTFKTFPPPTEVSDASRNFRLECSPRLVERALASLVNNLHK